MGKVHTLQSPARAKNIKSSEFLFYMLMVFFYSTMVGMIGEYRRAYLVDGLQLENNQLALYNGITSAIGYVMAFVYALILDNKKIKNGKKFKNLGLIFAVPCGLLTILTFYTPGFLENNPSALLVFLIIINVIQAGCFYFGGTVNMVAVVMSPDIREREQLLSFRGVSSAVGNSAPLVIVLVMGVIIKAVKGAEDNMLNYMLSAVLVGVVGTITMLLGFSAVHERITYSAEKKNPFEGIVDIVKNKHARVVIFSEFLKSFRGIATFMQPFIAAAMLGSSSKTLIFALPIGVGTMVGMLIINALLKKWGSKTLYIASGVYSVLINLVAFGVGYAKLSHTGGGTGVLEIAFVVCLFLTGLQFGASNLLPNMFQADILDDIELKTRKRLDAGLPFVIGLGSGLSGMIASTVVPYILYGDSSIIHYQQGLADGTEQTLRTKIMLLFFYTVIHGIMMLLAGLPFLTYKLTGQERARVHDAVVAQRGGAGNSNSE
ncbi:MAG: MFS transporter [Oscillospiraceae bacterium]|jgi:Na+/melibiose symporter-like transporter|nr:MFS transporter [Oscillospiraceae bacterium]